MELFFIYFLFQIYARSDHKKYGWTACCYSNFGCTRMEIYPIIKVLMIVVEDTIHFDKKVNSIKLCPVKDLLVLCYKKENITQLKIEIHLNKSIKLKKRP